MFHFKHFSLYHENSALKIGTDAVLLAAAVPVSKETLVLDIGCGCGVIAYCLAWKLRNNKEKQTIIGVDVDKNSINDAQKSLLMFPKANHQDLIFKNQSVQDFSQNYQGKFDMIVSNPPFFCQSLKSPSAVKNLSKHNDELPFSELCSAVEKLLSPHGRFFVILPPQESEKLYQIVENKLFINYQLKIQPTPNKPVNRIVSGFSFSNHDIENQKLTLRNDDNSLSEEYLKLTQDFYL